MKIKVLKVEPGTEPAEKLLRFVENSSWEEVREHTAAMIREAQFEDWESMFAAVDTEADAEAGGRIVGHASIMKTDYYPLDDIFPWISTVFVTEEYRHRGICGQLIEAINGYAKELGFRRTYIPSEFFGLYERYGYRCVKDIVNYGGGTDHLFAKEIG